MARGKQSSKYRLTSSHPEDLASGRVVAPGEDINEADLDLGDEDSRDQRLIDEDRLQKIPEPGSAGRSESDKTTPSADEAGSGDNGGDS